MLATAVAPRFSHVPVFASSAGQDAIDLAEMAGLTLDPWQRDVLIGALAEGPDGKWAATQVGLVVPRQNGKGGILEALELFELYLDPRCRLITHTAHRFDTCLDHFRRIRTLIEDTPELLGEVKDNGRGVGGMPSGIKDSNGKESIELRNGSRLNFKAREKGSGRGFSGDLVVLDEAFWLKDLSGLVPTLSARENPQLWFTSSAPLPRSESDRLRKIVRRGRALTVDSDTDPGAPAMTYFEWSAPTDSDLDDPEVLRMANPATEVGRITAEFSRVERAVMDDEEYARERLGMFPDDDDQGWDLINENDWIACSSPLTAKWLAQPATYAVEVTQDRKWASIAVAGANKLGVAIEIGEHRPLIQNGEEWLVDRLVELWKHKPKALLIDPRSPAGVYIRDLTDRGVTVTEVSSAEYAKACGAMHDAIRAHTVTHHDQPELTAAAAAASKRALGDAWVFDRRGSTVNTPLSAASLARWGHLEIEAAPPDWDFIVV